MSADAFDLENLVTARVGGPDGDLARVREYFSAELARAPQSPADPATMVVSVDATIPHAPRFVYGASGAVDDRGRFLVPDGGGHWAHLDLDALESSDTPPSVGLCCGGFKPTVLLNWVLAPAATVVSVRQRVAAPLHASGTDATGGAAPLVFSAWSGVGKTNMVLWSLARGGSYFGDDRVSVTATGQVLPSSRRVAVYGYNRSLVTGVRPLTAARLAMGEGAHTFARRRPGRLAAGLSYLANGLTSVRMTAQALGGAVGTAGAARAHVMCHATQPGRDIALERVVDPSPRRMAQAHVGVMEYEFIWFQRYLQTRSWALQRPSDLWPETRRCWVAVLESYFASVPTVYRLALPKGDVEDVTARAWGALQAEGLAPVP